MNTEETMKNIIDEKIKEKLYDMMKDTSRMNANFQEMIMKSVKDNELVNDKIQKKITDAEEYMNTA